MFSLTQSSFVRGTAQVSSSSGGASSFLLAVIFRILSGSCVFWGRELSRVSLYARSFFFGKDGVCRSLVEANAPENARMRRKKYPRARFVRLPRGFAFAKRLYRRVLSQILRTARVKT